MRPHDQRALEALKGLKEDQPLREVPRPVPREVPREAPRKVPREVPKEVPLHEITTPMHSTPPPEATNGEEEIPLTSPLPPNGAEPSLETEPAFETEPSPPPSDKDAEMHYHLGIAYKEMELFDYAISEFEQAALDLSIKFDSYMMLGSCFMEKGAYDKSIEHYKMAADIKGLSKEKLARINLHMGLAYEASGMTSEALDAYHLALRLDPSSEAKEKIKVLQQK
jgi:tetratricopeptide (TPR) repeat protein